MGVEPALATSGRIMAIDFGSKRLGIAVSDSSATLAQPVTVIQRTQESEDLEQLFRLAADYDVQRIVVGYPRTLRGEAGPQAAVVEKFIRKIKQRSGLPVDRYDERLTSKEARTWLAQMGVRGRKADALVDKMAAALILQSYLDRRTGGSVSC